MSYLTGARDPVQVPQQPARHRAALLAAVAARQVRRPLSRRVLLGLVAIVGLSALVAHRWFGAPAAAQLVAVGTLEATEVSIAAEVTARIREVAVVEGQAVRKDDLLVVLDDTLPALQYRQATPAEQQVLGVQLTKYRLVAPLDGVVLRRHAEPGEVAVAGAPLLTLADRSYLDLKVYLLQRELPRVFVGQPVRIEAEALPQLAAYGEVRSIAERAEFTPRNVQTPRDRLNLVYAVKIRLYAPDARFKPGMSVVARFEE